MDIEQFLARVIPPEGFIAVNWKKPSDDWMLARFFQRTDVRGAAGYLKWAAKDADAYFAPASFRDAHIDKQDKFGRDVYKGERKQHNAAALKCFWIDADVQRPGEKPKADCYPDRRAAATWLLQFLNTTDMPPPNMRVDSGYGYHWYWLLEEALTKDQWQPYADALVQALIATGFRSLAGLSSDAARILRPPETTNHKVGAEVPVRVMDGTRSDYPNGLVLEKLAPWLSATPARATPSLQSGLVGSPAAAFTTVVAPNMAAAATLPSNARPRSFARIAEKCEQVKQSLASHGNGDPYQLWHLGFLSLAGFCEDGADFVHEISNGDSRYTPAKVEEYVAAAKAERASKDLGAPSCKFFDDTRPGVCGRCPFQGKIEGSQTPWNLGLEEGTAETAQKSASVTDMPRNYRRGADCMICTKTMPDGSNPEVVFLKGNVADATLDKTPKGYLLTFNYELAGRTFPVRVYESEIPYDIAGAKAYLAVQHVSVERLKAAMLGDFLQAWITHLRGQHAERTESIQPFGYATSIKGDDIGVAVGGTLYRSDGVTEPAPGADAELVAGYTPHGAYEKWRAAYDLVCAGRPDLQLIVATAFGAPLMHFTGHKGLVVSAWSKSGTGKSSAIRVAQTVWSAPKFMTALGDTPNAVSNKIATVQCMPCFWDEMRVSQDSIAALVDMLFQIAQGKGKDRLNSNITHREVKEWETLVLVAGNAPLMDHVLSKSAANDAGAVRLFEYHITQQALPESAAAARVISQVNRHYGHAGRRFFEYLSTHFAEVDKTVLQVSQALERELKVVKEERIYIAGMACILVGARLATTLGIAAFDFKDLHALLKDTFSKSRADRQTDLTTTAGVVDAEQVLSRFNSDYMGNRLFTARFSRQGPQKEEPPIAVPLSQGRAEIQIARDDATMRINRATFMLWCRRQGLNALDVMRQLETQLYAVKDKTIIGGGTIYASGRMHVIDVPLVGSLAGYLLHVPASATTNALKSPPTKGNQPV